MIQRRLTLAAAALAALSFVGSYSLPMASAEQKPKPAPKKIDPNAPTPWDHLDYGPFLSASILAPAPAGNMTYKGVAVKLGSVKVNGEDREASICYDTQLLRVSAAWTGGFLHLRNVAYTGDHGPCPTIAGDEKFGTRNAPAWAQADGSFVDPRVGLYGEPFGGTPREYLHYKGLYRDGEQVVFSYSVNGMDVLETPGVKQAGDEPVFTRSFQIAPSTVRQAMIVAEVDNATGGHDPARGTAWLEAGETATAAGLVTPAGDLLLETAATEDKKGQEIRLTIPPHAAEQKFELVIWSGAKANRSHLDEALKDDVHDVRALTRGGPAHWGVELVSQGKLAVEPAKDADKAAYVLDELTYPEIPSNWPRLRFGGVDFFPDGHSAALCTWNGDVYVVKGIDEKLGHLTWRRVAGGMFQTLGLKIIDGSIYVHGRDQITVLHDLDGDGEADFYENFNNDVAMTDHFHEFAFDLEQDGKGDLYIIKGGGVNPGGGGFQLPITRNHGTLMKISEHGSKLDVIATGFRAPNGLCVRDDGQAVTGDNQGTWTPVDRLNWIKPDMFCGVPELSHKTPLPKVTDNPLCWFIYYGANGSSAWDNSCGDPVFVTSDKWGQPRNELFYLSYGQTSLMHIMTQEVDGIMEGGAVRFPWHFFSGCMRARFNPVDGQLYVCGFQGWQTNAKKPTAFERVRYTGRKCYMPTAMHVQDNGIRLTFSEPLKKEAVEDAGNWAVEEWNYRWTKSYGSKEFKATEPNQIGREAMEIKSVKLSADGKSIFIDLPDLQPVMQMLIRGNGIVAADGTPVTVEVASTINVVNGRKLVIEDGKVSTK